MVHIKIPYSKEKNLGAAYNHAMQSVPDGEWACLIDYDVMFFPDGATILNNYAEVADKKSLYTCYTNRINPLSKMQLFCEIISDNFDIKNHITRSRIAKERAYKFTEITGDISGFLMLINKDLWNEVKFTEDLKCLGVDSDYCERLRKAGR
jgi:GT2 family glycosyltransferase